MSDNRTTELLRKLRKMLDGCRRTETAGFDTYWITAVALDSSLDELEQAIAATLESDDGYEAKMDALLCRLTNGKWSKSRAYDLDFMVSCVEEEFEALYSEEQFVAPASGTLTAEQVCKAIARHGAMLRGCVWQIQNASCDVIADELNVALGGVECELVEVDSYSSGRETIHVLECSACGKTCEHVNGSYPKCPHCGRKAVKR